MIRTRKRRPSQSAKVAAGEPRSSLTVRNLRFLKTVVVRGAFASALSVPSRASSYFLIHLRDNIGIVELRMLPHLAKRLLQKDH